MSETLALLDAEFPGFADALARGNYALWLGSGISLDRVVGVPAVIGRVIEYLRVRMDVDDPTCRYKVALDQVLADLSPPEQALVHLEIPVDQWPENDRQVVTCRLAKTYAEVLQTPVAGEAEPDFLLWQAVDVQGCFTGDDPDVEHLCVVLLTLEGAFRDIASANWDYLIEAAERELTGSVGTTLDVCIRAVDFQAAGASAKLLKYHGCAVKAVADPPTYRPLLIARTPQIDQYRTNQAYQVMRTHLVGLVQTRRTLMIGFSAQDSDVKEIFVDGAVASDWGWDEEPKAFIFSEEQLKPGQKSVLAAAYGADYNPNRAAIEASARLRAYAKPLLLALVLKVLELKAAAFAQLGLPTGWDQAEKDSVLSGLRQIRDAAAAAADGNRLAFIRGLISRIRNGLDLYHHGRNDHGRYIPLSSGPLQQVGEVPMTTGLRQAAVALALLGRGEAAGDWTMHADAQGAPIRLDQHGRETRVYFAANDDVAVKMIQNGHIDPASDDTVLLLSASPRLRLPRSPEPRFGRTGKIGLREVCVTSVVEDAANAENLTEAFKWSANL